MRIPDWTRLMTTVRKDIIGIIHAQRILNEVNLELAQRSLQILEEDLIFEDGYGFTPDSARTINIDGVEIRIRVLHRRGLGQRDIKGADLLYEIVGRKFVLIQYKRPQARERVVLDRPQLEELVGTCPNVCLDDPKEVLGTCGAWYAVEQKAYLPACKALAVFGERKSRAALFFRASLSAEDFQLLFARCGTGARVEADLPSLSSKSIASDRVLFSVSQKGTFHEK